VKHCKECGHDWNLHVFDSDLKLWSCQGQAFICSCVRHIIGDPDDKR